MKFLVKAIGTLALVTVVLVVIFIKAPPSGPVTRLKLASTELEVQVLLENLEIPWDMSWSPDGWITPVWHALALHPEFPVVPCVYAHYTHSPSESRLVRFRFNPSALTLEEPTFRLIIQTMIRSPVFNEQHRQNLSAHHPGVSFLQP